METTLDQLVEHSDRLLMEIQGDTDLPLITRSLEQMGAFGEKLCSSRGVRSDVKAARLFGSKINYDLPKNLSEKLESLSAVGSIDITKPQSDMNIHSFLKCERENILFSANEQAKKAAFEEIGLICQRATATWWDRQAAAILTALASSAGPIDTDIAHSLSPVGGPDVNRLYGSSHTMDSNITSIADQSKLLKEEIFYAQQVDRFLTDDFASTKGFQANITAMSGFPLKQVLLDYLYPESKLSSVFVDESKHSDLLEVLHMVRRMFTPLVCLTDLTSETSLVDLPMPPDSIDRVLEHRASPELQSAFLLRAVCHLETEFISYMQAVVSANPCQAQLGGRPGTRSLVRAFINVKYPASAEGDVTNQSFANMNEFEDGLVDGKPVWQMIYYCLRSGAILDAAGVALEAISNLGDFSLTLESYKHEERRLSSKSIAYLRKTYRRVVKTSRDPFKRIVYCLLCRCDLSDTHSEVVQTIDDFLWLRLSQVSVTRVDSTPDQLSRDEEESLSLGQLQSLIYDTYGESHFEAWNQPFNYFKILCLSQQFEGAIGFLARLEPLRCHAVHIALLLHHLKVLLLPPSVQSPLVSRLDYDPSGLRRLNFARLILLYTRKFETTNPCQAFNYYFFLSDIESTLSNEESPAASVAVSSSISTPLSNTALYSSKSTGSLFMQCVAELVIQVREFDVLLGSLTDNGTRQPGAIDRFCTGRSNFSASKLISIVAETLEARGQLIDAVRVYLLAGTASSMMSAIRLTNLLLVAVVAGSEQVSSSDHSPATTGSNDRTAVLNLAASVGRSIQRIEIPPPSDDSIIPSDGQTSLRSASQTLFYLLDLANFFDLAASGQCQAALDHMDRLGIFPSNCGSAHIESRVTAFANLPDLVRRPLPNALIMLMRCLVLKANQAKVSSSASESGWSSFNGSKLEATQSPSVVEARSRARALITFVGRIPHRMPGEVYARLSQLEMQLS